LLHTYRQNIGPLSASSIMWTMGWSREAITYFFKCFCQKYWVDKTKRNSISNRPNKFPFLSNLDSYGDTSPSDLGLLRCPRCSLKFRGQWVAGTLRCFYVLEFRVAVLFLKKKYGITTFALPMLTKCAYVCILLYCIKQWKVIGKAFIFFNLKSWFF
jgi:hypothetical protein